AQRTPPTAVLGLTLPMAMGALRAAADLDRLGALAVVAVDGQEQAEDLVPAITAVEIGDLENALTRTIAWLAGGPWTGPLRRACTPVLVVRETSVPWRS